MWAVADVTRDDRARIPSDVIVRKDRVFVTWTDDTHEGYYRVVITYV